jgi:hypothetical protein
MKRVSNHDNQLEGGGNQVENQDFKSPPKKNEMDNLGLPD